MADVQYTIPPWLHGANPLQAVTSGAELGLRIAESNNRSAIAWAELQRRQQEFSQHVALQQQQLEREQAFREQQFMAQQKVQEQNQLREDQKLQIEKAYHEGQIGLKQQQLEMTANAAAEKANASGRFLQSLNTLTSGYIAEEGLTEEQARAKAVPQALFDSGLFQYVSPASIAGMAKSVSPREGQWGTSPGGFNYFQTAQGGLHFEPKPVPSVSMEDKANIADISKEIADTGKELRTVMSDPSLSDRDRQEKLIPIQERLFNAKSRRHRIFQRAVVPSKPASPEQPAAPEIHSQEASPQSQFGAPTKGQVISGYVFKGGDPSDQKNWELPSDQTDETEGD